MKKEKVIVSLTSFPAAISFVPAVVKSILAGNVLPDKIILYLAEPQFPNKEIPQNLIELSNENTIFEIRFCETDIRSYKKLIPALKDFPNDIIVTIDDDVFYDKNMLRDLLHLHKKFPDVIFGHRVKRIKLNAPYKKWRKYKWYRFLLRRWYFYFSNIQIGVGGVLYPPNCLKKDMLDEKLFREIAPTTDDIWFWAAAVANGTKIAPVPFGRSKPKGLGKPKEISLKSVNVMSGSNVNRINLEKILEKYPNVREIIKNEKY